MTRQAHILETQRALLDGAIARIEAGWCKNAYARGPRGNPVASTSPLACKWCLAGALSATYAEILAAAPSESGSHATAQHRTHALIHDQMRVSTRGFSVGMATYNDRSPNKARVLKLLRDARERLA